MSDPTLYTPQEIEHLGEEAFAELLFRALGGERVVASPDDDGSYHCIRCQARHALGQHTADEGSAR